MEDIYDELKEYSDQVHFQRRSYVTGLIDRALRQLTDLNEEIGKRDNIIRELNEIVVELGGVGALPIDE